MKEVNGGILVVGWLNEKWNIICEQNVELKSRGIVSNNRLKVSKGIPLLSITMQSELISNKKEQIENKKR